MYDSDQLSAVLTGHGLTAVPDGTGVFVAIAADTEFWLWHTPSGWQLGYDTSSPTTQEGAHTLVASDVPDAMVVTVALALIAELQKGAGPEVSFDLRTEAGGLAALKWLALHLDKPVTVALAFSNGTPFYTYDLTEAHPESLEAIRHKDGFPLKVKPQGQPPISLTGTIVCRSYLTQKEAHQDA